MQNTSIFYSRLQRGPWQTWRAPLATAGPAWLSPTPPHTAQVAQPPPPPGAGPPPAHRPQHRATSSPSPPAQGHLQPTAVRSCSVQDHSSFSAAPRAAPKRPRDAPIWPDPFPFANTARMSDRVYFRHDLLLNLGPYDQVFLFHCKLVW